MELRKTLLYSVLAVALGFSCCSGFCILRGLPLFPNRKLDRFDAQISNIPIPPGTALVGQDKATFCCGPSANYNYIDLVVIKVYESQLSRREIEDYYDDYLGDVGVGFVHIVFEDDIDEKLWGSRVLPNCVEYRVLDRFPIIAELPEVEKTVYVLFGWSSYGQIWNAYCH